MCPLLAGRAYAEERQASSSTESTESYLVAKSITYVSRPLSERLDDNFQMFIRDLPAPRCCQPVPASDCTGTPACGRYEVL